MLRIFPTPPFRLDTTVQPLHRLPINGVDRWDGHFYRRLFVRKNRPVELILEQDNTGERPSLLMTAKGLSLGAENKAALLPTVSRMLGITLRLGKFQATANPKLQKLLEKAPGLKPSQFYSPFETLVNVHAAEHLAETEALSLVNRFCSTFGPHLGDAYGFPLPQSFDGHTPKELSDLGFSPQQAKNLLEIAQALSSGKLDVKPWRQLDDPHLLEQLVKLPGIDRPTAEYVALRGFGRLDIFPTGDAMTIARLQEWLELKTIPSAEEIGKLLAPWMPYRGLIYFYLQAFPKS